MCAGLYEITSLPMAGGMGRPSIASKPAPTPQVHAAHRGKVKLAVRSLHGLHALSILMMLRWWRSFISGMRLCPQARIFASDPCFLRSAIASERLFGEKYSKGTGIMTYPSM